MLHIYKASAGSGKTYNLTRQYIKLLLGYRDPNTGIWHLRDKANSANRHILAITFTNKATEEMIKRIISQLAILAGREPGVDKPSPYLDYFKKLFNTDEETLKNIASESLDELLADFMYFHVSTIDAFFQNVLRTFAREIEMPDNFELELDQKSTIAIGVNEMFSSINRRESDDEDLRQQQKWIRRWMNAYFQKSFEDGKPINLLVRNSSKYSDLVETFSILLNEHFKANVKSITEYLSDIDRISAFEKSLVKILKTKKSELFDLAAKLIQYGDFITDNINKTIYDHVHKWANKEFDYSGKNFPKTISDAVENQKNRYKASYLKNCQTNGDIPPEMDRLIIDVCSKAVEVNEVDNCTKSILKGITPMGLLGCLLLIIDRYCREKNLILLSETNTLLRDIINDDDTPFVYERLGYYLRNFLIDEFQDTSRMQWQNLKPLIMESMSHDHENLIIGDEKQCIYRFRNSDPDLLGSQIEQQVTRIYGDDSVALEGNTVSENNNWRSSAEVIKFNNSLFTAMAHNIGGNSGTYSNVVQQISPDRKENIPGHVVLTIEKKPEKSKGAEDVNDNADETSGKEFALDIMERETLRMLKAGYKFRDIAILVRTHSEGKKIIDRLLSCENKPEWSGYKPRITSVDSISIGASHAVKMIIEVLRLTQLPPVVKSEKRGEGINPAYKRIQLLYCFEYYRNQPIVEPDGSQRLLSDDEALALALRILRENPIVIPSKDKQPADTSKAESGNRTEERLEVPEHIRRLLELDSKHFTGSHSFGIASNESIDFPGSTLSTIVEQIILQYIPDQILERETVYLTAFQDLVYDFCANGDSDISSFLKYWDRSGSRTGLASNEDNDCISVMTIHQSKGLEFPCVIIPFANWEMVNYQTNYKKVLKWFPLDAANFPEIDSTVVPPMIPLEFTSTVENVGMFKERAEEIIRQDQVDNLNIAYVALTRAVNELIIVAPSTKDSKSINSYIKEAVDKLTSERLADTTFISSDAAEWVIPLSEHVEEESKFITVEIGEPTKPTEKAKEKETEKGKEKSDNSKPKEIILPAYKPNVNRNLSTLTEADIKIFDFNDPRYRGDFLHSILRRIRHLDDLPLQLRRSCYRAHLNPEQTRYCTEVLTEALSDPCARLWFEDYSKAICERPWINPQNIVRPDRIVWTADGHVDVVDFKFGEPESSHRTQVRRYAANLIANGETNVRAFLWYLPTKTIVEVPLT